MGVTYRVGPHSWCAICPDAPGVLERNENANKRKNAGNLGSGEEGGREAPQPNTEAATPAAEAAQAFELTGQSPVREMRDSGVGILTQ